MTDEAKPEEAIPKAPLAIHAVSLLDKGKQVAPP